MKRQSDRERMKLRIGKERQGDVEYKDLVFKRTGKEVSRSIC